MCSSDLFPSHDRGKGFTERLISTRIRVGIGMARGLESGNEPVVVLGIRGLYSNSMGVVGVNDRGLYDDGGFITTPEAGAEWETRGVVPAGFPKSGIVGQRVYGAFNFNTDPSGYRNGEGFGERKGMAVLVVPPMLFCSILGGKGISLQMGWKLLIRFPGNTKHCFILI